MLPPDPRLAALFGKKSAQQRGGNLAARLAEPEPDPLADVDYTGDLAVDSLSEFDAVQAAFRDRRKTEDKRFTDATDSEFWFAVCFRTREEKDAFLKATGLDQLGDKYLDGGKAAAILKITNEGSAP